MQGLARTQRLTDMPVARMVHRLLQQLPDTGVHRLLRGLDRVSLPPAQQRIVADGVVAALRELPLSRLAALCLMDRWLKNADPEARDRLCEDAVARCSAALRHDMLTEVPDSVLLSVPGHRLERLARAAAAAAVEATDAWERRRQEFADRVLDLLESMPKSLSQANAEEFLSRRIYTNPGHFLVELLQNAEDAGAKQWHVTITDDHVAVWHDGIPFDAKDVVGVLSIGQTTKQREQIGFFGVGFKSVYEICERPQIYSDLFRFEVADVSIPRRLARRPPGAPDTGTLLRLPLRNPDDPLRSPQVLHGKALAIPPQTLLTLRNLEELRVSRQPELRIARQKPGDQPGRVRIVQSLEGPAPTESERQYLVAQDSFTYHEPRREASRVGHTPVLVAIALDDHGRPTPLPAHTPTVFSYLPTEERSGLRFMVHAHFDLPMDRERLDLTSPWNTWAIARAAELLGRLAERLTKEAQTAPGDQAPRSRLAALLDVLPRADELTHPAFAAIARALPERFANLPMLPGAASELLSPSDAAVLQDDRLSRVLAGIALDDAGRRLVDRLGDRAKRVALDLGAARFGTRALIELTLVGTRPGAPPPVTWLAHGLEEILTVLAEAGAAAERLANLSMLPDQQGNLWSADRLARASSALRQVYGDARPLIDARLQDNPAIAPLLDRLGLPDLGVQDLIDDLHNPERAAVLLADGGIWWVLAYLQDQPLDNSALGRLALYPDEAGVCRPLVVEPWGQVEPRDQDGIARLCPAGPLGAWLRSMLGRPPPLIAADLAARFGSLLARLGATTLDLPALVESIQNGTLLLAAEDILPLHRALNSLRADLSPRLCAALRRTSIFPDRAGRLRPVDGAGRAFLPADGDVIGLSTQAPWIDEDVAELPYVEEIGAAPVGAAAVVRVLLLEELPGEEDLLDPGDPIHLRRVYGYLIHHHEGLSPKRLARLADSPIWLDTTSHALSLDRLRRPSPRSALGARAPGPPSAPCTTPGVVTRPLTTKAVPPPWHWRSPCISTTG